MASSSSSAEALKYDVFLSFRGEDTRSTFTSHLDAALKRKQIKTYIDYELVRGEEIAPALIKAIEGSELAVVILSQDYASSKWCLDELVHIQERKERHGQIVIPIFYGVDPSDVRHQRDSYAAAFLHHEERFKDTPDRVLKWREALTKASNLAGFDSRNFGRESELVEEIVRDILVKLSEECSSDLKGLVGMESRIQNLESLLCSVPEDVRVRTVGIWGMGGVGKTTLAGLVFNRLKSQFEASYFLADVREESGKHGIKALRNELLSNLLKDENLRISTPSIGTNIKQRLSGARVLVVLDDVDNVSQLEILVGNEVQFGPGSRIIITTRDIHQLREMEQLQNGADHDVMTYKAEELDHEEALQLLQLNFFEDISGRYDYFKIIPSAAGIPLALKIWGSVFRRCKTTQERESFLEKLKRFPEKELQNVYRISYDALGENEREIFLYIACYHKGEDVCKATEQLNACGLYADSGIRILIDMSLVSIRYKSCLWMHDVIQEMGRAIDYEEHPTKPGKRKHLFTPEDICHVLKKNKGTGRVQSISLDLSMITKPQMTPQAFRKMCNLKFLKFYGEDGRGYYYPWKDRNVHFNLQDLEYLPNSLIYINWPAYSLKYLPATFSAENLTQLCMPGSRLKRLWNEGQKPRNLKRIDLSGSKKLAEVPDLSMCLNIESIDLERCGRLIEVPSYFENLHKLTRLNVHSCRNLRVLSDMPSNMVYLELGMTAIEELPSSIWCLEKLVRLCPHSCQGIKTLPNSIWKLYSVTILDLGGTSIQELPSSIERLVSLKILYLVNCKRFVSLPTNIYKLKSLIHLHLGGCSSFEKFPEILEPMELLHILDVRGTKLKELPCLIENAVGQKELELPGSRSFESVPNITLPRSTVILWPSMFHLNLRGCTMIEEIPDCIFSLNRLCTLNLEGSMIRRIPSTISQASGLRELILRNCELLESLPELPYGLECIDASGCKRLKTLSGFTEGSDESTIKILLNFYNCASLDEKARRYIMDEAHLRKIAASYYHLVRPSLSQHHVHAQKSGYEIRYSGSEMPKWLSNKMEGGTIDITLPPRWNEDANFLGFAFSVVIDYRNCKAPGAGYCAAEWIFEKTGYCTAECIFKTEDGESYTWDCRTCYGIKCLGNSENKVVVWFETLQRMRFAPCTNATRASFHFKLYGPCLYEVEDEKDEDEDEVEDEEEDEEEDEVYEMYEVEYEEYEVERCGVGFVYAQGQDGNAVNWQVMDEHHAQA